MQDHIERGFRKEGCCLGIPVHSNLGIVTETSPRGTQDLDLSRHLGTDKQVEDLLNLCRCPYQHDQTKGSFSTQTRAGCRSLRMNLYWSQEPTYFMRHGRGQTDRPKLGKAHYLLFLPGIGHASFIGIQRAALRWGPETPTRGDAALPT